MYKLYYEPAQPIHYQSESTFNDHHQHWS